MTSMPAQNFSRDDMDEEMVQKLDCAHLCVWPWAEPVDFRGKVWSGRYTWSDVPLRFFWLAGLSANKKLCSQPLTFSNRRCAYLQFVSRLTFAWEPCLVPLTTVVVNFDFMALESYSVTQMEGCGKSCQMLPGSGHLRALHFVMI